MLTVNDLEEIKKLIDDSLDERFRFVPDKNFFLGWMDKIMGEIKNEREENVLIENRMKRIEQHFPQAP